MAEILWPISLPAGPDGTVGDVAAGLIVDDVAQQVVAVYGHNNTEDDITWLIEWKGGAGERLVTLDAGQPEFEIRIPPGQRIDLEDIPERIGRGGVIHPAKSVVPYARQVIERVFANPRRSSPVILSVTETISGDATTHNVSLPATVAARDGLVIQAGTFNFNGSGTNQFIPANPTGFFTPVTNGTWFDFDGSLYWAGGRSCIKIAVGDEDGTTVGMNTAASCALIAYCLRIEAGSYQRSIASLECSTVTTLGSVGTSVSPPLLVPTWGAEGTTLWSSYCLVQNDLAGFDSGPANYTEQDEGDFNGTNDMHAGIVTRLLSAASEDPGNWTWTGAEFACSTVIAIRAKSIAPAFVNDYQSVFNTTADKTASVTTEADDILAILAAGENGGADIQLPTGGTPTYANRETTQPTNGGRAEVRADIAESGLTAQTYTLTQTSGGTAQWYGFDCFRFTDSDGIGASEFDIDNADAAPSLDIVTTQDNSALAVVVCDWNAVDGASRTWRTINGYTPSAANAFERVYFRDGVHYTVYIAYYPNVGTAGTKTVGLTVPDTMLASVAVVEILSGGEIPPPPAVIETGGGGGFAPIADLPIADIPAEGGVTAVGKSLGLVWDQFAALGDPIVIRWDDHQAVGDPVALQWDIFTPIGDPLQFLWDISAAVGKSNSLLWDVAFALGDPIEFRWDQFTTVGDPVALQWDQFTAVGDPLQFLWDINTVVGDPVALQWDIAFALGDPITLRWDQFTTVGDSVAFLWDQTQLAGDSIQFLWDIAFALGDPVQFLWDAAFALGDPLSLSWDVAFALGDDNTLRWDQFTTVGDVIALQWDQFTTVGDSLSFQWDQFTTAGDSISFQWDIFTFIGDPVQFLWDIAFALGDPIVLRWDIFTPIGDPIQLVWDVEASSTAVGKDNQLIWDIQQAVGDSIGLLWDIAFALGDPIVLRWDQFTTVGDPITFQWDQFTTVGDSIQALWDINAVVGKDNSLLWDIAFALGDPIALQWDIRAAVGQSIQALWDINAAAGKSNSLLWDIAFALGDPIVLRWDQFTTVNKSVQTVWDIFTFVGDSIQYLWDIRAAPGKNIQLVWDTESLAQRLGGVNTIGLLIAQDRPYTPFQGFMSGPGFMWTGPDRVEPPQPVGKSVSVPWDVLIPIADTSSLLWDILALVGDDTTLRWDVNQAVGDDLILRWDIASALGDVISLLWDVQNTVGKNNSLLWDQSMLLNDDTTFRWDVGQAVGDPITLRWDIGGSIGDAVSLLWDIHTAAGKDNNLLWDQLTFVGDSIEFQWDQTQLAGDDLTLRWDASAAVAKFLSLLWDIGAHTGKDITFYWDVEQEGIVGKELVFRWDIRALAGDQVSMQWDVRRAVVDPLVIRWDVKRRLFKTLRLIWAITEFKDWLINLFPQGAYDVILSYLGAHTVQLTQEGAFAVAGLFEDLKRKFEVGESITLRAKVSLPGTKIPTDPDDVDLTQMHLRQDPDGTFTPRPFTQLAVGDYRLIIPAVETALMTEGVWVIEVTFSGTEGVTLERDKFTLVSP